MDFASIIKTVAPWLATAITGPFGGMAVGWACDALGVADKTTEGLKQAMAGVTPEQMLALKNADQGFALQMQELGFEDYQKLAALEVSDRDSARLREREVKDSTPRVLAYAVIGGFIGVSLLQLVALMLFPSQAKEIPPQGWLLIGNISGYLAGEAKQAGDYYFGTNLSSSRKTELLSQAPAIE